MNVTTMNTKFAEAKDDGDDNNGNNSKNRAVVVLHTSK